MNSFMSWVGGKKNLRDEVLARFPPYYERYIEVFGGAGTNVVFCLGFMTLTERLSFISLYVTAMQAVLTALEVSRIRCGRTSL